MIIILNKEECCGCSACVQICPKQCISMNEDTEGFLYPRVDDELCINCHLCEKVCPCLHPGNPTKPLKVYAAKNSNEEIRRQSSSGGVFTALAESVIDEGGVVFGAKFDEKWEVVHGYTETKEGLADFRGSKYVQSRIENSFSEVNFFLEIGRKVLFSGTPCQVAGLKGYLRKEYLNLLTVDFICHGVPSPKVWRMYLHETTARQCKRNSVFSYPNQEKNIRIESISFRDKSLGWKKFSFTLTLSTTDGSGVKNTVLLSEPLTKNIFLRGFMSNMFLRLSCHSCKCRSLCSGSDVTIADCWGMNIVYPNFDDDKGASLVIVKNDKAYNVLSHLKQYSLPITLDFVKQYNHSCFASDVKPPIREYFFLNLGDKLEVTSVIEKYATFPKGRVRIFIVGCLRKMKIYSFLKKTLGN